MAERRLPYAPEYRRQTVELVRAATRAQAARTVAGPRDPMPRPSPAAPGPPPRARPAGAPRSDPPRRRRPGVPPRRRYAGALPRRPGAVDDHRMPFLGSTTRRTRASSSLCANWSRCVRRERMSSSLKKRMDRLWQRQAGVAVPGRRDRRQGGCAGGDHEATSRERGRRGCVALAVGIIDSRFLCAPLAACGGLPHGVDLA